MSAKNPKKWIKQLPGVYTILRKRDGQKVFYFRAWVPSEKGFRYFRLGTTLGQARDKRNKILGDPEAALVERQEKQEARIAEKPALTFDELVRTFLAKYRSRGDSDYYLNRSKAWLSYFGPDKEQSRPAWFVKDIDFKAVEAFREFRRAATYRQGTKGRSKRPIGDSTLRKDLTSLFTLFEWAMDRGDVAANPVKKVQKPQEPDREVGVLSVDEETKLLKTATATERTMIQLFIESGMRRGEGLSLKWVQIDKASGAILINKSKTGKARAIPMNEELKAVLDDAGKVKQVRLDQDGKIVHVESEYVLHDAEGKPWDEGVAGRMIDSAFERARIHKAAGSTFNLFRHTFGSRRAEAGVPLAVVAALMGNSAGVCEKRYVRFSPGHLQEAMNRKPGAAGGVQGEAGKERQQQRESLASGSAQG